MGQASAKEPEVWHWIAAFRGAANWRELAAHLRGLHSFKTKGCLTETLSLVWIQIDHPDGEFRLYGLNSPYVLASQSAEPNTILTEQITEHLLGLLELDPDAEAPGTHLPSKESSLGETS